MGSNLPLDVKVGTISECIFYYWTMVPPKLLHIVYFLSATNMILLKHTFQYSGHIVRFLWTYIFSMQRIVGGLFDEINRALHL